MHSIKLPTDKSYPHYIGLAVIAVVCIIEAFVYQHDDWLRTFYNSDITLGRTGYVAGYQLNNNIHNEDVQSESWGLAQNTYTMSGYYDSGHDLSKLDVSYYYPDNYRILLPFLASFLIHFLTLREAFLAITTLHWLITCLSTYYLGFKIFNSKVTGFIAGFLCATSLQYIMLVTELRGALFQLSSVVILVALSFYLGHFSDDHTWSALANSMLLGSIGGILTFGSVGSAYFFPFLLCYGILSMRFSQFIKRNIVFGFGFFLAIFIINYFTFQVPSSSPNALWLNHIRSFNFLKWWEALWSRYLFHLVFQVPAHLWAGALIGLFFIRGEKLKVIGCMFSTILCTELIMFAGMNPYWNVAGSYHHLQFIFAIYLLNAVFLTTIWKSSTRRKGAMKFLGYSTLSFWLIATLITSNLPLAGNYYYYHKSGRPEVPNELIYKSFFTFDNLSTYRDLYKESNLTGNYRPGNAN